MKNYNNNNHLKIAVVGGGYWGKNLVRNFNELGVLHTLCDTDQAIREESLNKCPGLYTTDSYDQVLQDPAIIQGWNCKCGKIIITNNCSKLVCTECQTNVQI
jgi:hypothetical protein